MIHTEEQALNSAREILDRHQIRYIEIGVPEPKAAYKYQNGELVNDVWVVSYTYMVFEEEIAFVYLDDRNELKLLYVLTKHGYETY